MSDIIERLEKVKEKMKEWHLKYKCDCEGLQAYCLKSNCKKVNRREERNKKIEEILKPD